MGLTGCCATMIVSLLCGYICIAIVLPENSLYTKGSMELEPSPPVAASGPDTLPQSREMELGLSKSRFQSRKLSDE